MTPDQAIPDRATRDQASAPSRRGRPTVTLIDGRSGSGKTELARHLAESTPGITLIRLDDIYPGWDGLDAASRHIHDHVLEPLTAGRSARWQRWDWSADAPSEWHDVDPTRPLIIEGCGALSRANRALADVGIWVELDAATRKQRALARDGDAYAPYWDRWAAQEAAFIAREHPQTLADRVVRTA
ncbi:AAA family ATPase [Parafrigoribacterium mesophilum]|uniref:zeta toxin family protein n=1 Tax=Parafrigoribacterium mesophilum TaxID=433646 RepID=UPI0031FDE2B4